MNANISLLEQLSAVASLQIPAESKSDDLSKVCQELPVLESCPKPATLVKPMAAPPAATIVSPPNSNNNKNAADWARCISLEERKYIRDRIRSAYLRKMNNNFEEILETCCAVEEELLFSSALSRLDYFKSGVQFEKRINEKRWQMNNSLMSMPPAETTAAQEEVSKPIKRAKTTH